MACPAYGSTSGVALYYIEETDPNAALVAPAWNPVPMTSESLGLTLTSSVSEQINATRSYAGSVVTKGELAGSFSFEAEASAFVDDLLRAVLQSAGAGAWAAGAAITNGKTARCFAFLKSVDRPGGTDYYVFRGCQIDVLSLSVATGSFVKGDVSVIGTRFGAGAAGAAAPANDILSAMPGTASAASNNPLMSSVFALQGLEVQTSLGADVGVIAQDLKVEFSNQLRAQFAVGTGTPYAAGVASSRFKATATVNAYYSGPAIINGMMADDELKLVFDLLDSADTGWSFLFDKVKVTTAPPPQAGGPDQDLLASTELQAFQSSTNGTVKITKSA